jgi:D-cysteine desulfhydrase family pyridoxal phosphate-dependent enzyme
MKSIPRIRFAHLPTPIEPLPRLSATLSGPRLFIKRDDQTGLAGGGNKTRKLEFLVAEAQANGALTLITAGAVQSNHCRQTAAAAARYGFKCILVLVGEKPEVISGNLLLDHLLGAEIVWARREERAETLQQTFQSAWEQGRRPYLIPYGGSNSVGAAGYVFAIQELRNQTGPNELLTQAPDWIVFPSSSGGTQAGLVLGAHVFNYAAKILGISVDEPVETLQNRVADLANQTGDFLGEKTNFSGLDILVNADYLGGGYGVLGDIEKEAVQLFARTEGILLDPVYTGRAAASLIDLIRKGFFLKSDTVLFWHTGGMPALFAQQYRVIAERAD